MRIEGCLEKGGIFYVLAYLQSDRFNINEIVKLVVDTGSRFTLINSRDAQRIKVNYDELQPYEQVHGLGASLDTCKLKDNTLILRGHDPGFITEHLEFIPVAKPPPLPQHEYVLNAPSMLGLDILKKYTISFPSYNRILLERRE